MIGAMTLAALAVLIGWVIFALSGLVLSAPWAAGLGALIGAGAVLAFRDTVALRGAVAVLGPLGVVLPLLALRHVAGGLGLAIQPFPTPWLILFLLAYLAFLAASMGVLPADPYRLGYAPLPVAAMVLALCAWGAVQGNLFVPLLAVTAQALWLAGWGSSNWFDHVLHVALVPVVAVVLIGRLVW